VNINSLGLLTQAQFQPGSASLWRIGLPRRDEEEGSLVISRRVTTVAEPESRSAVASLKLPRSNVGIALGQRHSSF